jgi:hypothetical protein
MQELAARVLDPPPLLKTAPEGLDRKHPAEAVDRQRITCRSAGSLQ